jgi:4-hydroxybutyryl-CoA dehydratase/vinylacetyl-CoA-Delta-isomerase
MKTVQDYENSLRGVADIPTENRMRILRLIENLTLGAAAVAYRTESMHGAGSPEAQVIVIGDKAICRRKRNWRRPWPG